MRIPALFIASALTLPLVAQDDTSARWRIAVAGGVGTFDFEEDGNTLNNDDASAGAFRLGFEGTSHAGFGGGLRVESFAAQELRFGAGTDVDAGLGSLFGHFTYRFKADRFVMPLRGGLLANSLILDETISDVETRYYSGGLYFEVAPEFTLVRSGRTEWTLYGEAGIGSGATQVEREGDTREWDARTSFAGLEFGTRLYLGGIELSAAVVSRLQSMDESDPEGNPATRVRGYDASFTGVWLGFAVVF